MLLLSSLLLSSCQQAARSGPVEIVYWTGWSSHEFDVQQELVDEFNKAHPDIKVRLLSQFGANAYQKVRIAFAGGSTPDVMSTVWADELPGYAMRNVLEPLDPCLKEAGRDIDKEFTPGVAKMLQVNGKAYALAVTTNTNFIVYNKALFKAAGLDPENPPKTVEELDAAAWASTKYAKDGSFVRYGFRPGGLPLWALVFGGQWYDPVTKQVTANHPKNIEALKWLQSYAKKYDLKRMQNFESRFGNETTPNGPFYNGLMTMWFTGEWSREQIRRYADKSLEWGYFALPAPPGGRKNAISSSGSVFVIPAACKHKKEAWEFLNWISSPYAVEKFCSSINNVPPLRAVGLSEKVQKDPFMKFAFDLANGENSFGPPPIPTWPTYTREISRVEEAVMLGGQDPKQQLDDLQVKMEKELRETLKDLDR